jgi:hypothetical protein
MHHVNEYPGDGMDAFVPVSTFPNQSTQSLARLRRFTCCQLILYDHM